MTHSKKLVHTAIAGVLALGASAANVVAAAEAPAPEKCYGMVKAGKNDCQTSNSACAGTSTKDGQADAFLYVPKGTCDKIVGGSTKAG